VLIVRFCEPSKPAGLVGAVAVAPETAS
jgi:hypothetical protein